MRWRLFAPIYKTSSSNSNPKEQIKNIPEEESMFGRRSKRPVHQQETKVDTRAVDLLNLAVDKLTSMGTPEALALVQDIQQGLKQIAQLPDGLEERNLLKWLPYGKLVYTVPWAMSVTEDGKAYLNENYHFDFWPGGTYQMAVKRTKQGYVVRVPAGERYTKTAKVDSSSGWYGIPVLRVEGADL